MRRIGGVWDQVASFENLIQAARRAARGKRKLAGVARFLERMEPEALALQRELVQGTWRPGTPTTFKVWDPKERTISAAPFRDRVVHHALIDVLDPYFDRRLVFESFACRKTKGTHAALDWAQHLLRRHGWFLKLDVRKCFDSIRHDVALETLARILKDRRCLGLFEHIVRAGVTSATAGVGLPIGDLTSQWIANLVLGRLDHLVKERLGIPGYVRYMDDFVLFAGDKERLQAASGEVSAFLDDTLGLALKARATILAPATEGLPFLGWRLYLGLRRLRPENLRRTRRRLRRRAWEFRAGRIDERQLACAFRSVVEHLKHGSTLALRRRWFQNLGGGS